MNNKKLIRIFLILFLLADISFSFIQYYNTPLYGDIQGSVLPEDQVLEIFDDPFGINAVVSGVKHKNPNRFFAQYFFTFYFTKAPAYFQNFVSPINSVYLASAFAKIIIQISFIFLLSAFISKKRNPFHIKFLISAAILAPLFQVYGYWSRMGIVDQSIAYTFFYAAPLVGLMLFFFPLLRSLFFDKKIQWFHLLFLLPLVMILPFSGPLVPALILLGAFIILLDFIIRNRNYAARELISIFPTSAFLIIISASLLSLYSLLLGLYNSNYQADTIPLIDRFARLPEGVISQIFHSLGFPMMLVVIAINLYVIKKLSFNDAQRMMRILKWIGIFSFVYIVLLPFGGYRPYRPNIIRYDTFMPVNVLLMFLFGMTTFFLFQHLHEKAKRNYSVFIIMVLMIYTFSDYKGIGGNACERAAFEKMASTQDSIVSLPKDCFVMSWQNNFDYKQSEKRAELIHFWGITSEEKLFYNEE